MTCRRTLWALALVAGAGLGISLYLAQVYLTGANPLCLGQQGCSTVQASPYAWVGPVPVPALGALFYAAVIGLSLAALARPRERQLLLTALLGLTIAGVMYSAYLTYVEFFVIYAVCYWCVASAIGAVLCLVLAVQTYLRP